MPEASSVVGPLVVELARIEPQVEPGRGVDELELVERRRTALATELVKRRLQRAERAAVLLEIGRPVGAVGDRVARERRWHLRVLHLGRIAGDDPHPRHARGRQCREADDVVLDDRVGPHLVEDLDQALVDVAGAVAERLERRRDEALELLDRRLAKDGRGVADEVLPELARVLLGVLGGRRQAHQPLLEALCLERSGERLLGDEDNPVAAGAQDVGNADAVVRRPVGALGEEDEGRHAQTATR